MLNFSNLELNDFGFFLVILVIAILALIVTRKLLHLSFPHFFMGITGLLLGLWIGSLIGSPLSQLPGDFGRYLPMIINVFVAVALLDLFLAQTRPLSLLLRKIFQRLDLIPSEDLKTPSEIILDTSVLIDGRIKELVTSGFISGRLIIPDFVLRELQKISDSKDGLRREKGRRGLEIVSELRNDSRIEVLILEDREFSREDKVDDRLILLAKKREAKIMTLDYNLNKIASFYDIKILNLNELIIALRPILLPGENILIKIIQKGKEKNQGIGYLPDGTMIVVQDGDKHLGEEIECSASRIYQTSAGKMIFAEPI